MFSIFMTAPLINSNRFLFLYANYFSIMKGRLTKSITHELIHLLICIGTVMRKVMKIGHIIMVMEIEVLVPHFIHITPIMVQASVIINIKGPHWLKPIFAP